MKATHPKTGKPISIMRTESQLIKTNRTILWYKSSLTGPIHRWQRWSTLVTDADTLATIPHPDFVLLVDEPTEDSIPIWKSYFNSVARQSLSLLSPKWLMALRLDASEQPSILVTTEFQQRYPFLPLLTETDSRDSWIASFAQLLRVHRIVTTSPFTNTIFSGTIQEIAVDANSEVVVPSIYLIQQYFLPNRAVRAREIRLALEKNLQCDYIDKIILLNESEYDLPKSSKLEQIIVKKRLTYADVLNYIKTSVPKDTIVAFANSDIYLDDTLRQLYSVNLEKKFLALLRYEITDDKTEPKLFGPRPDSQDTWIVWSSSIDFDIKPQDFDFSFGIPGCDNTITVSMLRNKFIVANPALSIKTYHLHSSNIRNYTKTDVIDKPVFLYVEPTAIQEYTAVTDLAKYRVPEWSRKDPGSFNRTIKSVDATTAETICTMMKRDTHYKYSVNSANTFNQGYEENDNKLYKFEGTVFTMPNGVVCDFKNIYVGNHRIWRDEWSTVPLTVLTNTVYVPCLAAVHFPQKMAGSAAQWFLHYLPQVLKIRAQTKDKPEFIVPIHPDTQRALQLLKWTEDTNITILPYIPDCQYVSDKVYALTPTSFHDVPKEDIQLLRSMVPPIPKSDKPIVVIVAERNADKQLSKPFAEELKKYIFDRADMGEWSVHIIDADIQTEIRLSLLMKADLVLAQSDSEWEALDWMWLMKPNATVVEMMLDTAPRGEHIHLAGASALNYVLLGMKREPLSFQRQHALEDMDKIIKEFMFPTLLKAVVPTARPIVVVPSGNALKGIHDHTGDTFREMTAIWAERNYVQLVHSEDTPYCWWNAIGDTLLYDRPTMRWWSNPSYTKALFGNAYPEKPTSRDKLWSFWGRSPRAIEAIVASKKVNTPYQKRELDSLFLGRIENGVQKENRTKHDWSTAVEKFSMPVDSTGGPYQYTQEQYLEFLTNTKFGLCLPGYGPKCNREIEYFATGVVPIVTPGIDMKNYAVPPQKGIHYFYAETPEQVQAIVRSTTEEQWTKMSEAGRQWWQRYASAEGLFRFTWGLVRGY